MGIYGVYNFSTDSLDLVNLSMLFSAASLFSLMYNMQFPEYVTSIYSIPDEHCGCFSFDNCK